MLLDNLPGISSRIESKCILFHVLSMVVEEIKDPSHSWSFVLAPVKTGLFI